MTCRQGVEVEDGAAIHAHVRTMIARGYLERVVVSGSRARMQGAALTVTFRAKPVALALLDLLECVEALEAQVAALRPQSKSRRSRATRAAAVSSG